MNTFIISIVIAVVVFLAIYTAFKLIEFGIKAVDEFFQDMWRINRGDQ